MSWLNQAGTIVLGELDDREHLRISLEANDGAEQWLESVPAEQRDAVVAEVCRTLGAAGLDIKRVLVRALQEARDVPPA